MKRHFVLAVAMLAVLVVLPIARAQDKFPTGTYTGGAFTLSVGADGVHTVSTEGKVVVKGTYVVDKDKISFTDKEGDFACLGQTGTYKWASDGKTLSFTKVEDECEGRAQGLGGQPWARK